MTPEREIERLLDGWLANGPMQVSDRVLDDVASRIAHQRQRPAWRLRSWRFSSMTPQLRLLALGAALGAVALGGLAVLSGGGPGPGPTPPATPSPSPSGSAFACYGDTTGCAGPLAAGPHTTGSFSRPFQFQTPDGWVNVRDIPRTYGLEISGVTEGPAAPIEVMSMIAIADQTSTQCAAIVKNGVGSSVSDLIAYVQGHPGLDASSPVAAALDGHTGQRIDFTVASTWRQTCDQVDPFLPAVLMLTDTATPPGRTITYTSEDRVRWIVLDVGGDTVVIEYVTSAVIIDYESVFAPAQRVVDTIHFLPSS